MVVTTISPLDAWHRPLLRLVDTLIGVGWAPHVNGRLRFSISGSSGNRCDDSITDVHLLPAMVISDFNLVSFSFKCVFFSSIASDGSRRSAVSSCAR